MRLSLKAARVNAKLTQKQAAKKIGVSKSSIYKWETGKLKPNVKYLHKIEDVYNVGLTDINF